MNPFIKIMAALAIGAFGALILLSLIGRALELQNPALNKGPAATVVKLTAFGLFLILGYSLVPLMLHVFLLGQGKIGNGAVAPVSFLGAHEVGVACAFWAVFTAGLLVALPVMWTDFFGFEKPLPKSQGAIVANVGITLADVAARSSCQISPAIREPHTGTGMSINEGVFDFETTDGGIRFERCRYCAIQTGKNGDTKIVHINVGISPRKMKRDRLTAAREEIARRLGTAGWLAGHYEYSDPAMITLHGGTREGDGRYWAKDAVLLVLGEKRMDEAQPGEEAATAGEFIQVLDVLPRNDPLHQALIFEPTNVTGG